MKTPRPEQLKCRGVFYFPDKKETWAAVMQGNVEAMNKKWVPLYNIHKVFAGLRDAYLYAGNEKAKDMLIRFGDWFVRLSAALTPQKMEQRQADGQFTVKFLASESSVAGAVYAVRLLKK